MAKRIQYRAQLAFKPASAEHMRVYQYLRELPDKTDYIVRLVLADLSGENGTGGRVASRPEKIDYNALVEMLRPTLEGMVRDAMKGAAPMPAAAAPQPPRMTSVSPPSSPQSSPLLPPELEEDLELALEGLKAFGI